MVFEDLRAFVTVARLGSFARAAADLCIAQSALSKRVQRLEHRMGAPLLERHARGVALTEAGHAFLARAQRVVDDVGDMERNLSTFARTPSGQVRVALPQRTAGLVGPPLIERVRQELPLVDLQVPYNFIYACDTVGGSSGSPVVNRAGEFVGINFDSVFEGQGGYYVYDADTKRAVAVDARAILQALERVMGGPHLARELRGTAAR